MKETFFAIRAPGSRAPSLAGSGARSEQAIEILTSLDAQDLREARRDPELLADAPTLPMALLEPVAAGDEEEDATNAWGIGAVGADVSPYDGEGISVAILDTGIDLDHPAFVTKRDRITVHDFTDTSIEDTNGHGTHCAGTIFGDAVNGVRIGVAPGIKKALVGKVYGPKGTSNEAVARAIQWAIDNEAHVISMSIGVDFPGLVDHYQRLGGYPVRVATSKALIGYRANIELFKALVEYQTQAAIRRGTSLMFIAAAGNESRRTENADYAVVASPPAASDGFLAVGALAKGPPLTVAPYSNTGVRVCAPGSGILSAKRGSKDLIALSGTSMATPHVAGVAALWAQKLMAERRTLKRIWEPALVTACNAAGIHGSPSDDDIGAGLVQAPRA